MVNYSAIHAAYKDYQGKMGNTMASAVPQPEQTHPMHKLVLHAMAMHPNKEGETQGTMLIRALTEHLKRISPDVSKIHKENASGTASGQKLMSHQ